MPSQVEHIAAELSKKQGAVLVDVQTQGSRNTPPDSPGFTLFSVSAEGEKLTVGLAFPNKPDKKVYDLVVEAPAGFKQHKSGVWDIASAKNVWMAGSKKLDELGDSLAVRFLFQ